ncbi:uncharacterized protein SPPG_06391 [Spizellomyces punctatus DAOM BR117]|uniref:F-box domain-containing protein n=1 Tax=Spizellomyces punctatus (strain DAOM BR117) TaxID=645134 RepID=A0A0L0HCS7_SPIPD|nr:uncharacterized protein SPPG_06391 [Spizellomyces punctatus DAOM BR117]KNC98714.1 hypothetical protein SPPG_06391 [Spizellomyces punctatus DAOM BR117]|eukprot:XP_016606754.1 hypothetical protein SPPG_06391 [Spizellomyces punctatus DAOM BR117]
MAPISILERDRFSTLPQELSIQIIKFLSCSDVGRLAQTSRHFSVVTRDEYLWNLMTAWRFGKDALSAQGPIHSPKELYQTLSADGLSLRADKLSIVWNDGRYWQMEEDLSSQSGLVATLRSVCWFDVRGQINGVPRGKYIPIWRIKLVGRGPHTLSGVTFKASTISEEAAAHDSTASTRILGNFPDDPSYSLPTFVPGEASRPLRPTDWTDFVLPELSVGDWEGAPPYLKVEVEAIDHADTWKFGLKIDGVRLVRVGEEERIAQESQPNEGSADEEGVVPLLLRGLRTGVAQVGGVMRDALGLI